MKLNSVLRDVGLDPKLVSLVLHLTKLEPLRSLLPVLADQHPDLFDAYQSVHSKQAAATLSNRPYLVSFVPIGPGRLVFAGLFEITAKHDRAVTEIYADPRFARLAAEFGATDTGPAVNIARGGSQRQFTLTGLDQLSSEIGRLQIAAPGTRAYVQIAANLNADVLALTEQRHMSPPLPHWTQLVLGKAQVQNLPSDWLSALTQWRCIYLITDVTDGARYVGSAYGQDNIIGRWRQHVAGDLGITRELRARQTAAFQFSILEILRHDEAEVEVIRREHGWMDRLHTRTWGLNT